MTILQTSSVAASNAFGSGACTVTAASLSSTDVQAALNAAVAGDIVCLPAGTANWSTQVSRTLPANVTVRGAGWNSGTTGGGDATIIQDNFASSQAILSLSTNATGKFRLSGITFRGGTAGVGNDKYDGMVSIGGSCHQLRVDHCHWDTTTYSPSLNGSGVQFVGWTWGVIDKCLFDNPANSVNNSVRCYNQGTYNSDSLGVGDEAWAQPTGLGSANSLYIEDCLLNNGVGNDSSMGGNWVFRYNTFTMSTPAPSLQTHPTGGGARHRGGRSWESYNNTFNASSGQYINACHWISAGTGVIWGNTLPSSAAGGGTGYRSVISTHCMRYDNGTYTQTAPPNGWGYAGTHQTGTGSNYDGNTDANSGYPALDQPGRGQGDRLINDFNAVAANGVKNQATGADSSSSAINPRQALEPIYEWHTIYSPVPSNPSSIWSNNDQLMTANVDIYLGTNDSGNPITFTGATGVGYGLLSARPSSGLTAGVGWFATDTQTLYVATGATTWTTYYTPYTYPHPLRS